MNNNAQIMASIHPIRRRPPRDHKSEAGAIVDEWHPVFRRDISLRVDRLIALAEQLDLEGC